MAKAVLSHRIGLRSGLKHFDGPSVIDLMTAIHTGLESWIDMRGQRRKVAEPHLSHPPLKLLHFGVLSRVQGLRGCFCCLER
jgi:hypothetical protein